MYGFLLVIHVCVAIFLIVVILIQRGRGGGLVESFSGVESMFGTRTSQFLTRATTVLATIFLFTSISLALLSARQSRSLIEEEAISPLQERVQDIKPIELKEPAAESEVPAAESEVPAAESEIPAVEAEMPTETPELPVDMPVEPMAPVIEDESIGEKAAQKGDITE
ncbi:MAG: preprotein translocase subunit SecG [Candidatus Omnitrophota bacterium]|jgi:preprotein translocase subunit SecG